MKILYISKSTIPSRTANSVHVMKMCQAFSDIGHDVVLLAPHQKSKYEEGVKDVFDYYGVKKNFTIKKLWHPALRVGSILYLLSIFFYLVCNRKFDLVFGRFLHGCFAGALLNHKVVFESHEDILSEKNNRSYIFKRLIKNKNFIKLIVISQALKDIYLKNEHLNSFKIEVAHDGADEVLDFNQKVELLGPKNTIKVGYVGHLYKGRGIDKIFEFALKLKDMTFHIVGGLEEDIIYWKTYCRNLKLNNVFFYGFVPPKETVKYRNSFDLVLAPYAKKVTIKGIGDTSKFMSPIKIFEYMSNKKAIIASDIPVIKEVLNETNSILLDYNNVSLWISAIEKLRDVKTREMIANKALADFYKYTWKNRAKQIIKKIV